MAMLSLCLAQSAIFESAPEVWIVSPGAQTPDEVAGTLKKLTAEEQVKINRESKPKNRVKAYLRVMDARLKQARALLSSDQYRATSEQLEIYAALVEDAARYLDGAVRPRDNTYKQLELGLRDQLRLLEGISRDMPAAYLEPVEQAIATVNRVRRHALDLLISGDKPILRPGGKEKSPDGQPQS
jgi:hypothetical protein